MSGAEQICSFIHYKVKMMQYFEMLIVWTTFIIYTIMEFPIHHIIN